MSAECSMSLLTMQHVRLQFFIFSINFLQLFVEHVLKKNLSFHLLVSIVSSQYDFSFK